MNVSGIMNIESKMRGLAQRRIAPLFICINFFIKNLYGEGIQNEENKDISL